MEYREAKRVHTSLLADIEKRCLIWMAKRLPDQINSDHLTALAGLAMLGIGICYWLAPMQPWLLVAAVVLLAVNWFGDSLDGTVARVRHHERPRYGFYVDHVLDAVGIAFLSGGLVFGGYMSPAMGAGFLLAYYLLTIEIALATHRWACSDFMRKFGPTELRISSPSARCSCCGRNSFAVRPTACCCSISAAPVAIVGLLGTFIASAVQNTRTLYRAEPLPDRRRPQSVNRCSGVFLAAPHR
jgi:phosphatidylglycerophosphate synthase